MTRNIKISGGFVLAMAVTLIFPLVYQVTDKEVPPLPDHHTYQAVLSEALPDAVKVHAEKFKCSDYILPVKEIGGEGKRFPGLECDVNLALKAYEGWQLSVDEDLKEKMINRADERFRIWGNMGVSREMIALSKTQKNVAMKTHYSARSMCMKTGKGPGDDMKLVLTVDDERTQTTLFEIPLTFIDPATLSALTSARDAKIADLNRLRKRARISMGLFAGVTVLFLSFLLVLSVRSRKVWTKQKGYRDFLCNEIEKREALINDGHFVTALDLADRYLAEFSHDTEIKAFRSRLMDYTNQDPERAQQAYVEWKKLKTRMANPDAVSSMFLSDEEKQTLSGLVPYHPELKQSVTLLIAQGEKAEQASKEQALDQLREVMALLRDKQKDEALALLREIRKQHPQLKQAKDIYVRITRPEPLQVSLINGRSGRRLDVFLRQMIVFGRKDQEPSPDVIFDDRRVSRKHLAVHHDRGAFVVEDLGSAGGTFVNGDAVTRTRLSEGDLLNLSKVIDFDVFVQKNGNGMESGLLLRGVDRGVAVVAGEIGLDLSGGKIRCPGTMVTIMRHEGLTLVMTPGETLIPANGDTIKIGDETYKVEVLS